MKILVLNGPNLGRLGSREPEVYGSATHEDLTRLCEQTAHGLGVSVEVRQTEDEADLVRWIHEAVDGGNPVVINPAAFTHYSYSLRDACAMRSAPLIEVHISNPHARESFRHISVISGVATAVIAGFGIEGYRMAIQALASGSLEGQ